jgi:hypothetical protein
MATKRKGPTQESIEDLIIPRDPQSESFVKGLIARGEAVRVAKGETLPPDATHEIVGETETGLPILRRRRFI